MAELAGELELEGTEVCLTRQKRPELLSIVKHYNIEVSVAPSLKYKTKAACVKTIMMYWAHKGILNDDELERFEVSLESPSAVQVSNVVSEDQLAFEREKLRDKAEQRAHELQSQVDQRMHELEVLQLQLTNNKDIVQPKQVNFEPAR